MAILDDIFFRSVRRYRRYTKASSACLNPTIEYRSRV
jgi:hypothetical protein